MAHSTIKKGSTGADVRFAQQALVDRGYSLGPAGVDGFFGVYTDLAVRNYQRDRSSGESWAFTYPLAIDGIVGPRTWFRLDPPTVRRGSSGDAVRLLQAILTWFGYDPQGIDGIFGAHTEEAVRRYQHDNPGLVVDGIVGPKTWRSLWS